MKSRIRNLYSAIRISGFSLLVALGVHLGFALAAPAADSSTPPSFHFTNVTDQSLALYEGSRPVFVYNHGVIRQPLQQ